MLQINKITVTLLAWICAVQVLSCASENNRTFDPSFEFIDHNKLHFETAQVSQREFLIDFAITSNDIYQTRISDRKTAEEVLDISPNTFTDGVVELLMYNTEIVGFFTLKIHANNTQDSCELGHLFVKAGLQYHGLGTILFTQAMNIARERGFKQVTWISGPDAKEFYLKMGGHITGYGPNKLTPNAPVPLFSYNL